MISIHICELGVNNMSVKSAQRVLNIFEILADHPGGLSIKEISEALDIPQSSTYHLLNTLTKAGYLNRDELKKYRLGAKLIHIGTCAMESLDIYDAGVPHLRHLMQQVDETVFMAVLSDDELVYVAKIDSNRSIRTTAHPGAKRPLYCTGLGKAFLTFLPEPKRKRILDRIEFKKMTHKTITDRQSLEKQLQSFKKRGYSIDDEESEEGLYCLAAPIFGRDEQVIAAISVAGPRERVYARRKDIVRDLKSTAYQISKDMGYRIL